MWPCLTVMQKSERQHELLFRTVRENKYCDPARKADSGSKQLHDFILFIPRTNRETDRCQFFAGNNRHVVKYSKITEIGLFDSDFWKYDLELPGRTTKRVD